MQMEQTRKRPQMKWLIGAVLMMILALALTACSIGGKDETGEKKPNAAQKIEEGEDLIIPIGEISESAAFYSVTVDGTAMEVIAVKAPDGSIRTAFNTCQVCYDSGRGYYQQSGNMLACQNCGNQFPMSSVEVEAGGCNPWPIFAEEKTVTDESITISYDFLKASQEIFSHWKAD